MADQKAVECKTYSVDQAARMLGIGRSAAYDAATSGQIPAVRIGRRILIPRTALDRMLELRAPESK
jgi:excisionase family DNA binding protein